MFSIHIYLNTVLEQLGNIMTLSISLYLEIRQILFLKVPETRKPLLLSEIDRVAQVCGFILGNIFNILVLRIFFCLGNHLNIHSLNLNRIIRFTEMKFIQSWFRS